jgi:predicted nucleotidyltransferase
MKFTETSLEVGTLFCDDYSKKLLLSEIARKIRKNHRTIRLHVNMLRNLGILGTTKKEKLVYVHPLKGNKFFRYIKMVENYKGLRVDDTEVDRILRRFNGRFCVIFGSFASGEATDRSDIDVLCDSKFETADFAHNVQFFTFQNLSEVPDPLFLEVAKNHLIIKGSGRFVEEMVKRYG